MAEAPPEFDLIANLWAPLSRGAAGAFGLQDDVAQLPTSSFGHVVTCDQIIEGTHFLPSDGLDWVAKRLVRRNLSDLIAKGCRPIGAFLALAWPKGRPHTHLEAFARGLGQDLVDLGGGCPLLGGDTSSTDGPLVASLTLIGTPLASLGQPILRQGAKPGDLVFMTGTLGDPFLGLQVRLGRMEGLGLEGAVQAALAPAPPPLACAEIIASLANASIDISDGLLADAGHVAFASAIEMGLQLEHLPLSSEAQAWVSRASVPLQGLLSLATGGDDYQTLMCVAPDRAATVHERFGEIGVAITQIGICTEGQGLTISYQGQNVALPPRTGWQFSDA